MEVLDTSIANVALPHIAGNLGASQDQSTWVLTSYLVSNAIVLPISGWLVSVFGRKRFFMTCIVIFTDQLAGLRHRAQPGGSAGRARGPGWGRGRSAADGAGHSGGHVSAPAAWACLLPLWGDGHLRSVDRPDPGRLDHGQLHLALDFPDEPAGRHLAVFLVYTLVEDPPYLTRARALGQAGQAGLRWLLVAGPGRWRIADPARQGAGR